jgi:imidazole glycerol-phosphate synthase subunit HisF
MPAKRLIPILLIKDGGLMKSTRFGDWKYVGDPLNTAKIFNDKDTDELVVLDVDASRNSDSPNFELIEALAAECFLPIAYGGGVRTVEHALDLVKVGVDKVCINSAFFQHPGLLRDISAAIGASSTVLSVDVYREGQRFLVRGPASLTLEKYLSVIRDDGPGELIVQSVDRDGTLQGPDLELATFVSERTDIPLVYAGGVSCLEEAQELWRSGFDAVAAGAWFVFNGSHRAVLVTYPQRKKLEAAFRAL